MTYKDYIVQYREWWGLDNYLIPSFKNRMMQIINKRSILGWDGLDPDYAMMKNLQVSDPKDSDVVARFVFDKEQS